MKKTFILLTVLCSAYLLRAQESVEIEGYTISNPHHTLVRSWDAGNSAITYYDDNQSQGYILYTENPNSTTPVQRYVQLPSKYAINDMCILDDKLIMCGIYKGMSIAQEFFHSLSGCQGWIGYMELSDFVNNNPNPDITIATFSSPVAMTFRKIVPVMVHNGGLLRVVMIGVYNQTSTNYYIYHHYAMYEVDIDPIAQNVFGDYYQLDDNTNQWEENVQDLVITDDYIATIGWYTDMKGTYKGVNIRRCNKYAIYPDLNTSYCYAPSDNDGLSVQHATAAKGNDISFASLGGSANAFETRIRTVDLNTMTMTHSQYYSRVKAEPYEMTYVPEANTLVIADTPFISAYYVTELEYEPTATYFAPRLSVYGDTFSSVTVYQNNGYVAADGGMFLYRNPTQSMTNAGCYTKGTIKVGLLENLQCQPVTYPYNSQQLNKSMTPITRTLITYSIFNRCYHP